MQCLAASFAMGLQAEEKSGMISHNNRCEWNVMDHAIMQSGCH